MRFGWTVAGHLRTRAASLCVGELSAQVGEHPRLFASWQFSVRRGDTSGKVGRIMAAPGQHRARSMGRSALRQGLCIVWWGLGVQEVTRPGKASQVWGCAHWARDL